MTQGVVQVYGESVLTPPLLSSDKAGAIVIRDVFDSPIFVFRRMGKDMWGMASPSDPDWSDMLLSLGIQPAETDGPDNPVT